VSEDRHKDTLTRTSVFEDLFQNFIYARRYWRTRAAVLEGKPLYNLLRSQRAASGFLDPWAFNLQQSFLSSLPSFIIISALNFLRPLNTIQAVSSDSFRDTANSISLFIYSSISPFYAPLVSTFLAFIAASASSPPIYFKEKKPYIEKDEKDLWNQCMRAYLYLEAAYGFWPEMLISLPVTLSINPQLHLFTRPYFVYLPIITLGILALIYQT
jgi:hypothetical protein